jgi:hypothetical protein
MIRSFTHEQRSTDRRKRVEYALKTGGARLHSLRKNSGFERFVTGHDFSRADKPFILFPESASADDRKLAQRVFPQPVQACIKAASV